MSGRYPAHSRLITSRIMWGRTRYAGHRWRQQVGRPGVDDTRGTATSAYTCTGQGRPYNTRTGQGRLYNTRTGQGRLYNLRQTCVYRTCPRTNTGRVHRAHRLVVQDDEAAIALAMLHCQLCVSRHDEKCFKMHQ